MNRLDLGLFANGSTCPCVDHAYKKPKSCWLRACSIRLGQCSMIGTRRALDLSQSANSCGRRTMKQRMLGAHTSSHSHKLSPPQASQPAVNTENPRRQEQTKKTLAATFERPANTCMLSQTKNRRGPARSVVGNQGCD